MLVLLIQYQYMWPWRHKCAYFDFEKLVTQILMVQHKHKRWLRLMPSHTSHSFVYESYWVRLLRRNPCICRCFGKRVIFHSFISEFFCFLFTASGLKLASWGDSLRCFMFNNVISRCWEVTWGEESENLERLHTNIWVLERIWDWKWLRISEGPVTPPPVFQKGDGLSRERNWNFSRKSTLQSI